MPDMTGQSLGRYHILEQLGEGGMATVYKAYDTQLERDVAVKVIRRGAFPPDQLYRMLKRFEREAKALGRLTHPNIISVIDYGEYEDSPYLVMPYITGGTLKQRIKQGELPWQEAVRLLIPIAHALEYAHQHGIIHRDIKPSNILLADAGEPMLSDFGVAKLFENEETAELTGTGMGVGTPEYMAPEQTGKHIDHRVDIYALGIVLYEMVTGRRPYEADTPLAVLMKQASEPLPRPKQFTPSLPNTLEKVIIKALAKKPDERYQNMGEVAKALEGLIVVKVPPVEKKPKEPVKPLPAKRIDWKIPAVVAIVLLAVVVLVTLWRNGSVAFQLFPVIKSQNTSIITQPSIPLVNTNPSVINTPQFTITKTPMPTFTPVTISATLPMEIIDEKGVTMRLVSVGPFTMGSEKGYENERPVHQVKLDNYYMDVYEVTNAQFRACEDAGKCIPPTKDNYISPSYFDNAYYDNYPVVNVDWNQAKAFCEWRGARLPTEAEWEKAARGTDGRTYPWGNVGPSRNLLNFNVIIGIPVEVGSYKSGKSPYEMYDMAGNVSEWVNDVYQENYYENSPLENPIGPLLGDSRVIRGGDLTSENFFVRSSIRRSNYPSEINNALGFRCARSIPTASATSTPQPTPIPVANAFLEEITDPQGVTMRLVPAGPFTMGTDTGWSGDARPAHSVTLDDYYMDVYEVTNAFYKDCVDAGVCTPSLSSTYRIPSVADYPITHVDWFQAKAYCEWRGARLPTEAEWEKAARGTDGRSFPWGEGINCSKANYFRCRDTVIAVGSYEVDKSPYGIYDTTGNAWEWVNDWYGDSYYWNSPSNNPVGPSSGSSRVVRGGSWYDTGYDNNGFVVGAFLRSKSSPSERTGFRCASSVPPEAAPAVSTPQPTQTPVANALPEEITDEKGVLMRPVAAGPFTMGSNNGYSDEAPVHTVILDDYYMDVYEVTNAQYAVCVDAGGCTPPSGIGSNTRSSYYGNSSYENFPVINMDWNQAKAYCEWRGARLPTEAEWEKAARGTDGRIYPWGNRAPSSASSKLANNSNDTTEVGSYEGGKSPYGMYDMAGNVWEWVNDWYDSGYYQNSPAENPQGPSSGYYHVLRGGSFLRRGVGNLRSVGRYGVNPAYAVDFGFRCSLSAASPQGGSP